jgi:hypothetical protein
MTVDWAAHDSAAGEHLVLEVTAVISEAVRDGDPDLKGVFAGVDRSQTGFERSQVRERWVASRRSALAVCARPERHQEREDGGLGDEPQAVAASKSAV